MHQNKPQGLGHSLWPHIGEGNRGPSDGIPSKKTKLLFTLNVFMNIEPFTSRFLLVSPPNRGFHFHSCSSEYFLV